MAKGKIIPFSQKHPFSPEAAKRWNKIPQSIQKERAYCGIVVSGLAIKHLSCGENDEHGDCVALKGNVRSSSV